MAKRKKYSAKTSYRKFKSYKYYREKAWQDYSKSYDKLHEKYGATMTEKYDKQTFFEVSREELQAAISSETKYKFSGQKIADLQIETTKKEARAGARNFNRNFQELREKVYIGTANETEQDLYIKINSALAESGRSKLNASDIRSQSKLWERIYGDLKEMGASDRVMGSK